MTNNKRTVIIGIDGVPYNQIKNLAEKDVMPNLKNLFKSGHFSSMRSSIPDVSSVSWSTIITGKNPGEHGIFGFTHLIPGTYTMSFPNFKSLKAPPFWKRNDDVKYVIVNVPFTYPAQDLNGFLVSGFVALDLEKAVYPSTYISTLKEMEYEIDVDAKKWEMSHDLFMRDLFRILDTRVELGKHLWNDIKWDTFMFVFTGSDRIGHLLWGAYEDQGHKYHEDFLKYYSEVDKAIGDFIDNMSEEDNLIMLSDHGMEQIECKVNLNTLLMEEGLLSMDDNPKKNYGNIREGTKAFSMDPGRIYLNKKGKYPLGEVNKSSEKEILDNMVDLFKGLKRNGSPVIDKVHIGEDIYSGPNMENAPDLVLEPSTGVSLRSNLDANE